MVQRTIKSNEQKQDDNEILNREDENLYRYNGDIGPKSGTDYAWIPEALKSLYRSPGYKKNNWSYVKLCPAVVVILELRST